MSFRIRLSNFRFTSLYCGGPMSGPCGAHSVLTVSVREPGPIVISWHAVAYAVIRSLGIDGAC